MRIGSKVQFIIKVIKRYCYYKELTLNERLEYLQALAACLSDNPNHLIQFELERLQKRIEAKLTAKDKASKGEQC